MRVGEGGGIEPRPVSGTGIKRSRRQVPRFFNVAISACEKLEQQTLNFERPRRLNPQPSTLNPKPHQLSDFQNPGP